MDNKRQLALLLMAAFSPPGCIASFIWFIIAGMFWASLDLSSGLTIFLTLLSVALGWVIIAAVVKSLTSDE